MVIFDGHRTYKSNVGGKWLVDGAIKWMVMVLFEKQIEHYMRQRKKERIDYVHMSKKTNGRVIIEEGYHEIKY